MDSVKYWNSVFSKLRYIKPEYDLWLEKYKDILSLSHDFPIVDLGCGDGGNSLYLNNNGYQVISCDFSEEALNIVKLFIPKCIRLKFDFAKDFPFDDDSVKCIIADLSIHYFNKVVTMNIIDNMQILEKVMWLGGIVLLMFYSIDYTIYYLELAFIVTVYFRHKRRNF